MPTASVNGINVYYESHGDGFPLVFAYGIGGNTTEWEPQIPAFSERYRFIVWDPRGHGRSDSPPDADQYTRLLYTPDAADEEDSVDLGCLRYLKKKKHQK